MNGGNGTLAPSHALANYLNKFKNGCNAEVIDIMSAANPLGEMLANVYNYLLSKSILSTAMYMELAHAFPIDRFPPYNSIGTAKCVDLICKDKPDAIVLICPWISRMVQKAIRNYAVNGLKAPRVFLVVVDLGPYMTTSWINNQADFTFVSTENGLKFLFEHGLERESSANFGVPLFTDFSKGLITPEEKKKARVKNNIDDDTKVITILGGREGVSNTTRILKTLTRTRKEYTIIAQCGKNKKMLNKIKCLAKGHKTVRPMGYVQSMRELYSLSDVLITKPGAVTVSELVVSGSIFILDTWPVVMPQEKGNVIFVQENTFGSISKKIQDIPVIIEQLLEKNSLKEKDKNNQKLRKDLYGTEKIGDKIIELIGT